MTRKNTNKWHRFERGSLFSSLEPHMIAMGEHTDNPFHVFVPRFFAGFHGPHVYWAYGEPELQNVSIEWLECLLDEGANGALARHIRKKTKEANDFLIGAFRRGIPKDARAREELHTAVRAITIEHSRLLVIGMDGADVYFCGMVAEHLRARGCSGLADDTNTLAAILRPAAPSAAMRFERALLQASNNDAEKLFETYLWMLLGWNDAQLPTVADVKKSITERRALSERERAEKIADSASYEARMLKNRRDMLARFSVPPHALDKYFAILDYLALLKDARKEIQIRCLYLLNAIRWNIAHERNIPFNRLTWLTGSELSAVIRGKALPDIRTRKQWFSYERRADGSIKKDESDEAQKAILRVFPAERKNKGIARGTCAAPGVASGPAFVATSSSEANERMKKGDILICAMTTPDFIPAMRRAAAIVTEEGGITCHAAIISREYGIPCVIGTKCATKVFRDGDMIEVDAIKGIVQKQ